MKPLTSARPGRSPQDIWAPVFRDSTLKTVWVLRPEGLYRQSGRGVSQADALLYQALRPRSSLRRQVENEVTGWRSQCRVPPGACAPQEERHLPGLPAPSP